MNFEDSVISRAVEWASKKKPATDGWMPSHRAKDDIPYLVEVIPNQFDVWTCIEGKWTVGGEPAPFSPHRIAEIINRA